MGERGPVGKRSDKKHGHRSKAEVESVERALGASHIEIPEPDDLWHPIAKRWFEALAESGQSAFYEPSDWAEAQFLAEVMSRGLLADRINGPLLSAIQTGSTRLMATEADRRRLKLELTRETGDADEEAAVTALDAYRNRLSG